MASKPRLAELVSIFVWFRSGACSDPGIVAASETTLVDIGQHMLRGANHSGRRAQAIGLNPAPLQHDAISQAAHDRAQVLLQSAAPLAHELVGHSGRRWRSKERLGGGNFGDVWSVVAVDDSGYEQEELHALKIAKIGNHSVGGSEASADMDREAVRYLKHEIDVMKGMAQDAQDAQAAQHKCRNSVVLLEDSSEGNEGQSLPFYVMAKMQASLDQYVVAEPPMIKQAKKMGTQGNLTNPSADPALNFLSLPLITDPLDFLNVGLNTDTSEVQTDPCFSKVAEELISTLICLHRDFERVHGDLKDDNILYGSLDDGQCPKDFKLSDFSLTQAIGKVVDKYPSSTSTFHLPAGLFAGGDDQVELQPEWAIRGVEGEKKYKVVVDIDYCSAAFLIHRKFGKDCVKEFGSKLADRLILELTGMQKGDVPKWLPTRPKLECGKMGSDHIALHIPKKN